MATPRRITNAAAYAQVEYSTLCAFSLHNKWLLLQDGRGFYALHTGAGEFDRLTGLGHNSECRWDSADPNIFFYLVGNTIRRYDAMTHESKNVRTFYEYVPFDPVERNGVQGLGEGDIENNLWALAGMRADGKRDVFMYDLARGKKGPVLELEPDVSQPETFKKSGRAHGLDNLYATPGGNVQIGWYASGKERFQGVELYDSSMQFIRQLATVMSHNDVASYQGRDVLLWGSSADAKINANAIWLIDNQAGGLRMLRNLEWSLAFHASACAQDFAIISTYAPDNSLPSQLLKVRLDGSGSEVLCATDSVMMRNDQGGMAYNPTPRASVSRDGSRVVFNSNGGDVSRGPNYCDVFMLTLEEAKPVEPPKPPPIVVQPDLGAELVKLIGQLSKAQMDLTGVVAERDWEQARADRVTAELTALQNDLSRAQETARVATAQVTGLRQELEGQHAELKDLRQQLSQARGVVEVSAAYLQDVERQNADLKRRMDNPGPDPDIWPAIDFLQRGHLPGQRWGFELQDNGKHKMFDVNGNDWLPIAIPEGNQYLFVETKEGIEQRERKTNRK